MNNELLTKLRELIDQNEDVGLDAAINECIELAEQSQHPPTTGKGLTPDQVMEVVTEVLQDSYGDDVLDWIERRCYTDNDSGITKRIRARLEALSPKEVGEHGYGPSVEEVMYGIRSVLEDHGLILERNANAVLYSDIRQRLTKLFTPKTDKP